MNAPGHHLVQLTVNGEPRAVPEGSTIAHLLAQLKLHDQPCAVEINKRLVRKRDHATEPLRERDVVEIVTLVGGG